MGTTVYYYGDMLFLIDMYNEYVWYKLFTQQQRTCNITIRNSNEDMRYFEQ